MILIDSVFIHTGGGLTILNFLIESLQEKKNEIYFLFDSRYSIPHNLKDKVVNYSIANGFKERYNFYKKNNNFSTVFCLGNLAPPIKLNSKVITYLHSDWYVAKPIVKNPKKRLILFIKKLIFQFYVPNSNYYVVQTNSMKNKFLLNNKFDFNNVLVYPIFNINKINHNFKKNSNSYIYVSEGYYHKNHFFLIEAFDRYTKKNPDAKLYITIKEDKFPEILEKLKEINNQNIINIGFVSPAVLESYYNICKYLIFPSKQECFGLGLVEAIKYDCYILGSDLDYVYDICEPSITFDPYDKNSIYNALELSMRDDINPSSIKIESKIDDLINLIAN